MRCYSFFKFIVVMIFYSGICFSTAAVDVKRPDFTVKRGFYKKPFFLKLKPRQSNAAIKYTLDGSAPSLKNGLDYKGPIRISKTTFVRAMSFIGKDTSSVRTHTYIFPADVIKQKNDMPGFVDNDSSNNFKKGIFWTEEFDMSDVGSVSRDDIKKCLVDIPSISIVTEKKNLFSSEGIYWGSELQKDRVVPVSMEMIYPKGYKGNRCDNWQEDCGLKIQGGHSRVANGITDSKQSFSVLFKGIYGTKKLTQDIFKAAPFNSNTASGIYDRIILRAGHNDSWTCPWDREHTTYTRDEMARTLQLLMTGWGSHGTFVHLYLNGKYWGLYNPCERADDNMMAIYLGGEESDYFFAKAKDHYKPGSDPKYEKLIGTDWTNSTLSELGKIVDIDNFVNLAVIYIYSNPGDAYQYYFGYNTKLDKPLMFTIWDVEASFGGGALKTGDPGLKEIRSIRNFDRIKNNIDFKLKVADHAYKHVRNDGLFVDETIVAIWDSLNGFIEKAILCELGRWGDEKGVLPDWSAARDSVRRDFLGRAEKFINVLRKNDLYPSVDAPLFYGNSKEIKVSGLKVSENFALTMSTHNRGGIIYYTPDGSDPRKWDLSDRVSGTAVKYNNRPLSFKASTIIKARTFLNGIWSPLHEISILQQNEFIIKNLRISEIHYNPSVDGSLDGDNFEFIELKNIGNIPINLTSVSFDMGIYYTFKPGRMLAPGKCIVLASNTEMFNRRYKFHPLDVYKGQLKNEGETIRLVDGTGTMIDSVVYSDKSPWPVKADGAGYSLAPVYADRLGDPNDAKTWSRSSLKNGTPGKDDPKSIIAIDENVPNMFKMFTVCYVGRFRILIPFKKDFQVTILNLQGRTIADFAQRGKLQYQWTPGCDGLFFIRFRSKNGKQLVKKVLIMN